MRSGLQLTKLGKTEYVCISFLGYLEQGSKCIASVSMLIGAETVVLFVDVHTVYIQLWQLGFLTWSFSTVHCDTVHLYVYVLYLSLSLSSRKEPMPDPVPPAMEWQRTKPSRLSLLSASRSRMSNISSLTFTFSA